MVQCTDTTGTEGDAVRNVRRPRKYVYAFTFRRSSFTGMMSPGNTLPDRFVAALTHVRDACSGPSTMYRLALWIR